jgi:hypothetical protein
LCLPGRIAPDDLPGTAQALPHYHQGLAAGRDDGDGRYPGCELMDGEPNEEGNGRGQPHPTIAENSFKPVYEAVGETSHKIAPGMLDNYGH